MKSNGHRSMFPAVVKEVRKSRHSRCRNKNSIVASANVVIFVFIVTIVMVLGGRAENKITRRLDEDPYASDGEEQEVLANKGLEMGKDQPFGWQSIESNGHDIASSVARSIVDDSYFMVGTTTGMLLSKTEENALHVGMHCYLMQVRPFESTWSWFRKYGAYRKGNPVSTTCTSVKTMPLFSEDATSTTQRIVVTGYTEGDSIFEPKEGILAFSRYELDSNVEMEKNKVNGFIMVLDVDDGEAGTSKKKDHQAKVTLVAGKMIVDFPVQYPVDVAVISSTDFVVACRFTDDDSPNAEALILKSMGEVNELEPLFRYGNRYGVHVKRFSLPDENDDENFILKEEWTNDFDTSDERGADVKSIVHDPFTNAVIFAGTTHGRGQAFGNIKSLQSNGNDMDGYITKLVAESGELYSTKGEIQTERLESHPGKDEFIQGMCTHGRAIYVVGYTNSLLDPTTEGSLKADGDDSYFEAFLQKRVLDTMRVMWTRQIGIEGDVLGDVKGLGCAIDHVNDVVFISGQVENGASVVSSGKSYGGRDVFVASFHSNSGNPNDAFASVVQVGSSGDDQTAIFDGGLTVDGHGNVVLFGTSRGSLISPRRVDTITQYADSFLMNFLAKDAAHVEIKHEPSVSLKVVPINNPGRRVFKALSITVLSVGLGFLVFYLAYTYGRRRSSDEIQYQNDQDIQRYLEEFESRTATGANGDDQGNVVDTRGELYRVDIHADDPPPNVTVYDGTEMEEGDAANEGGKSTYEELMQSYREIQDDLGTTPSSETMVSKAKDKDII